MVNFGLFRSFIVEKENNMGQKRVAKQLTVTHSTQLTKNMRRITFQGDSLIELPENSEGAYFKFVFEGSGAEKPIMRTYTIANYRAEKREIDVDFMLHGKEGGVIEGVAAPWAMQARVGDKISILGPGSATFINTQADWYLLAADMTAMPALIANIARLPQSGCGYIVVEILSAEDQQDITAPPGMKVFWVVNPSAGSDASPLNIAIRELPWLEGEVAIWAACEFKTMKKLRQFFRVDKAIERSHLYISSYWKQGLKEEDHKIVKSEDAA